MALSPEVAFEQHRERLLSVIYLRMGPALRARMYSVRFFVGFLGSAAAAPLIGTLHQRTGSLSLALLVLAAAALATLACALLFPDRPEELRPELWSAEALPAPAE